MNRTIVYTHSGDPLHVWSALTWKTGEMVRASVQVIGHRSNRMWSAGSSHGASDRRELALMGQEKIAAATESAQAVALGWMKLSREFDAIALRRSLQATVAIASLAASRTLAQSMARQTRLFRDARAHSAASTSHLSKSVARLAHHGLQPIHSRATGNAKRLAKC